MPQSLIENEKVVSGGMGIAEGREKAVREGTTGKARLGVLL